MFAWYCVMQVLDGLLSYYHGHILAKQVAYVKALGRHNSIFSREKETVATKGENALLQLTQKMVLEHKRSRVRSFLLISLFLRFAFRVCIFFIFCHLSDYYESTLFHVGSNPFEIQPTLWHNDLGKRYGIVRLYSNSNNNDDDDDNDCLITIMIVAPCCALFLCFLVP